MEKCQHCEVIGSPRGARSPGQSIILPELSLSFVVRARAAAISRAPLIHEELKPWVSSFSILKCTPPLGPVTAGADAVAKSDGTDGSPAILPVHRRLTACSNHWGTAMAVVPDSMTPLANVDPAWAWEKYVPDSQRPWNLALASHLYRRAGFGANWTQLQQAMQQGPDATIGSLFAQDDTAKSFYETARRTAQPLIAAANANALAAWWLHVMMHSPQPLVEKLTLFWHGHFATSASKVTEAPLMARQNDLLRRYALADFSGLLGEMSRDAAMLVWLDSATNRKSHPNENFAREVMELFSLGLGNYTEKDIKEAARAFTGFEVRQGEFKFNQQQHDPGPKNVLGQTGPWQGQDVIRILLEQPATGQFIVGKLFRFLVSESADPPATLLEPLAANWRGHGFQTGPLVRQILESNLFFSSLAVGHKIKAPVEFAIGLVRAMEGGVNTYALADDLNELGQSVFFPPNVKGWDGGTDWINSSTLVARANLVWALVGGQDGRYRSKLPLAQLGALADVKDRAEEVRRLAQLLLGADLAPEVLVRMVALSGDASSDKRLDVARVVHAIATLPEFQIS